MAEYRRSLQRCRSQSLTRTQSTSFLDYPGRLARTASVPSLVPSYRPYYESYLSYRSPIKRYERDTTLEYARAYDRYKHCTPYAGKYYARYFVNTDYILTHPYYIGNLRKYYGEYRSHVNDYGSNKYLVGFYDHYHKPYYNTTWYSRHSKPYYKSSYRSYRYSWETDLYW